MAYKKESDRHTWPVQTTMKPADGRRLAKAARGAGLTQAEFVRGLILKHLKGADK